MTRTYALQRLLQHGPLTRRALAEVTGWEEREIETVLRSTTCDGRVQEIKSRGGRVYQLPATHFLPNLSGACHG